MEIFIDKLKELMLISFFSNPLLFHNHMISRLINQHINCLFWVHITLLLKDLFDIIMGQQ